MITDLSPSDGGSVDTGLFLFLSGPNSELLLFSGDGGGGSGDDDSGDGDDGSDGGGGDDNPYDMIQTLSRPRKVDDFTDPAKRAGKTKMWKPFHL